MTTQNLYCLLRQETRKFATKIKKREAFYSTAPWFEIFEIRNARDLRFSFYAITY